MAPADLGLASVDPTLPRRILRPLHGGVGATRTGPRADSAIPMIPDATDRGRLLALRRSGEPAAARSLLWRMRRRRLWQLWVRFGLAFGHVMSHLMLWILYWTLFLPFGLL